MSLLYKTKFDPKKDLKNLHIEELSSLYELATMTLEHCSQHIPGHNLIEDEEVFNVETQCHEFQSRLLLHAANVPLGSVSDVKSLLDFWHLGTQGLEDDLDMQDHLIRRVWDYFQ